MTSIRTALVTGASSGIGRELAKAMARDGVEVALAARRTDLLEELANEIRGAGGAARAVTIDVTDAGATQARLLEVDEEMGGLDLVVANAGVDRPRWSGKLRWVEDCEPVIAVNVSGMLATVTALLPRMVERKRGHVAATSSLAKHRGLPRFAVYAGSKAFVSNFLEALRIDLRGTGVAVTDIRPGFVTTPMTEGVKTPKPFVMDADAAAAVIWKGLRLRRRVVEFPWPLATALKSSKHLPAEVYEAFAKKFL
jgi:NADP-dependent 3-hydroxy acid dehydrogenase YdfG